MPPFDPEDVIDEAVDRREASSRLKRDLQSRGVGVEPCAPLASLVMDVVHQPIEIHWNAHCPIASSTETTRTGARFSARMPGSIVLRSPTTTTAKRLG